MLFFNIIKTYLRFYILKKKFKRSVLHYPIMIDNNSKLGTNTVLFKNVKLHKVKLGNFSYIQENSKIYNCNIGSFCSIAPEVVIGLIDHPTNYTSTSPVFYDKNQPLPYFFNHLDEYQKYFKKTIIEHDCWIGQRVMIKAGVRIGVGSIIGAGSLITKDVEPYTIVGGVPGKVIRKRFKKNIIKKLLKSKWWELSEDNLKKISIHIDNPIEFLKKIDCV